MQKQNQPVSCSLPPPNQEGKTPSMVSREGATPTGRPGVADDVRSRTDAGNDPVSSASEDFEFCILSSGGLALAGDDAADMCVADEVFSGGKLLPFRLSSANSADASALVLLRSDSLDGAATAASTSVFSSRSVSRSTSSSSSSSCVSRSTSSKSASSDPAGIGLGRSPSKGAPSADAAVPARRSVSGSAFYAHPSPSPRRSARPASASAAASAPRRSTGSAPPASWGVIRLGVVGAPEVYAPRPADYRKAAAAAAARGGIRSARFDQPSPRAATKEDKKLALGLLGAGLVCSCSAEAVAPVAVGSVEVAAAEARRRRRKAEEKKRTAKQSGQSTGRRSWILEWLEDLSISKEKSFV